ncbi:MAG: molybdate ABC transporter substrate-binding protein [Cyclobacteriaceae bacterium]|nr:molybdate ABC transporter substrate-binding protein [Cyclobacteriaceae bacterium]
MKRVFIFCLVFVGLISCNSKKNSPLRIAAAANLRYALDELVDTFEISSGVPCEVVISSSGKLTAQIESGAPFDIFLSADMAYPNYLYEKGIVKSKPEKYATGALVLWGGVNRISGLNDLLKEEYQPIAIANPETAPYGKAAFEVLKSLNSEEYWVGKLVYGESISQVNQFLISGAVSVGFTSKSVIFSDSALLKSSWISIPDSLYSKVDQGFVILNKRPDQKENADIFGEFLLSKQAKDILRRYGYTTEM